MRRVKDGRRCGREAWGTISGLDAVLHAVALAFDDDGFGVVQDAVEDDLTVAVLVLAAGVSRRGVGTSRRTHRWQAAGD
jgi:hypothetical protein